MVVPELIWQMLQLILFRLQMQVLILIFVKEQVWCLPQWEEIYQWSDGVIQNVPFIPTATHTYFVTVSFVTGCSSTDDITITVNPLPVADAGADQEVCYGESVTLSAAGGNTYNWSGSVVQDVAFIPVSTEVYTVTVTSTAGCSSTDNVTVTVNDLPVVDAGIDQTIPYQTSTTIDATVTGGSGSYTYARQHAGRAGGRWADRAGTR